MALPTFNIDRENSIIGIPISGNLQFKYNAFQNLNNPDSEDDIPLVGLNLPIDKAGIDITSPIEMNLEESYDGSVNIILTDKKNSPKIVNSRFYTTSSTAYKIADRDGNVDTNIYSKDNFKIEASLVKVVQSIVNVNFRGISEGGKMPVGNYHFYFKLADADGNESDFIAESGTIVCHIGTINTPASIRGGQLDENSGKLIKLTLKNLDLAYNYINVYYSRATGDGTSEIVKAYKITDRIKITGKNTDISITGYESYEEIALDEINVRHVSFESVKTIENCQNITFSGNISNNYEIYKQLEKLSLFITPQLVQDTKGIGNLNSKYAEIYNNPETGYEYYNVKNIYSKLGLWEGEIYRYGIYYILNDYSISPIFNIRGIKELSENTSFQEYVLNDEFNYGEDYILEKGSGENVKGVFKVSPSTLKIFNGNATIKPLGVKFKIPKIAYDGGLKNLTRGFVIVRQKRIPTVLAQTIGIATSKKAHIPVLYGTNNGANGVFLKSYFSEAFLKLKNNLPTLGASYFTIHESEVIGNSLLCPEANLKSFYYGSFLNSSEYKLFATKYKTSTKHCTNVDSQSNQFSYIAPGASDDTQNLTTNLLLIEPGTELIRNGNFYFSSQAGNAEMAEKHLNPFAGNYEDPENDFKDWDKNVTKVRGLYNTFIGCSTNQIQFGQYYNIMQKDYDFDTLWKEYFKIRYNDNSPYLPVSDRIEWSTFTKNESVLTTSNFFRGDCYINTYTHRMNWNFIDPELPTNHRVVDPYTWNKNFKIKSTIIKTINDNGQLIAPSNLKYNKLLPLFTFTESGGTKLLEPDDKGYKTASESNGVFGSEKINRPDVNAVGLGHWLTFKICSSTNLALRDLDFSNPQEEAIHKQKRGFFPLQSLNKENHLPESNVINQGISNPLGHKYYFDLPEVPFIKTNFANRIYYSNILQNFSFTNGNRVFKSVNYQDYTMEYGALVKLIEWFGTLIAVMEHGILLIPVNERAMMANESGQNVYINTENVLPQNPQVISSTFGSTWPDSIIKTTRYIYGIDTVAKKIWRTDGKSFENISDMQIQKFLNDNIKISELENGRAIGTEIVKTHFNAFKSDVYFTLKYGESQWNLCWNELLNKWVTQYSWFPEFSENINNIFYTFANKIKHPDKQNTLYKHGFAGGIEQSGEILPTKWYDEVYPFEFEFVVSDLVSSQKIFDNLKLIANATPPHSFEFEVIGNGFDWVNDKNIIIENVFPDVSEIVTTARYYNYLSTHSTKIKLPFIHILLNNWPPSSGTILRDLTLYKNNKTKEITVKVYQKGQDLKFPGMTRIKANMQYLEDIWEVQIQPIKFQYVYLLNGVLTMSDFKESKLRDKYLKVRVRYDGNDYAIINAIKTIYTVSYA